MDQHQSLIFTPTGKHSVSFAYGQIRVTDESQTSVTISVSAKALADAIKANAAIAEHVAQSDNAKA